ncbi:MAG: hypothetical protein LC776_01570 [Acidobacteria bacterium]|nr:hypothetical protein [Acidobacteriota bacterium]
MSDPRLYEWIALRRVVGGGMAKSAGVYFDHGRPVPEHLTAVFDRLVWDGLLVVAEGDPIWGLRRVSLTEAGQARYVALGRERQQHQYTELEVPGAEFGHPPDSQGTEGHAL